MTRLTLCFFAFTFVFTACPDETKSLNEERKELIDEVGGAPKRTIDDAQKRIDASMKKMNDRLKEDLKATE